MLRHALICAAALPMLSAARPQTVDYRMGLSVAPGGAVADVELRLRGDDDGETRMSIPTALAGDITVKGARAAASEGGLRVLRHRPGAKLTVRYRVRLAGTAAAVTALGDAVFATPQDRDKAPATFAWGKLPAGWRVASDLEHGAMGRAQTVADSVASVLAAGPGLSVATREAGFRAVVAGDSRRAEALADIAAPVIAASRAYWSAPAEPYLVVAGPFLGAPKDRGGDAATVAEGALADPALRADIARAQLAAWIPARLARAPSPPWFDDGFRDFLAQRILLRAGLTPPRTAVADFAEADSSRDPSRRGALLALKWDEAIRIASGGKADLDDVIRRMGDHYLQFPLGQGPDVVTGLVSAAWVTARLDLRPDIARFAAGGVVDLPDELFGGCLQARVTISPGFDAGFDAEGSFTARTARGVRTRGPAWNSGLRNGMRLDAWTYQAGDMTRQIELTVRAANGKGRVRKLAFWPYGDADVRTRRLQLTPGMSAPQIAACGQKIGGL